jgi:membrane protein implicated in regulation of membrane protease activity
MNIVKNSRLIIAILTSLLDEALIIFLIIWGLPKLGIYVPLYVTILICAGFVVYAVIVYKAGSRALFKHPVKGFTDLVGLEGKVVIPLNKKSGTVLIAGELWEARAEDEEIEAGSRVIVISQRGFKIIVRRVIG